MRIVLMIIGALTLIGVIFGVITYFRNRKFMNTDVIDVKEKDVVDIQPGDIPIGAEQTM